MLLVDREGQMWLIYLPIRSLEVTGMRRPLVTLLAASFLVIGTERDVKGCDSGDGSPVSITQTQPAGQTQTGCTSVSQQCISSGQVAP